MKHKVSELKGALLDAAVAKLEGLDWRIQGSSCFVSNWRPESDIYQPSTDRDDGGPIVERELIATAWYCDTDIDGEEDGWRAAYVNGGGYFSSVEFYARGETPLVAAMRAYLTSKFGDEVEL